jgi:predicted RNA-binding protein (virulence factor B family)
MIEIGRLNRLKVVKRVPFGVYLSEENIEEEILLPNKYVPKSADIGAELEVFLYLDSEDRLIATTLKPKAMVGEFAWLKVVGNSKFGAFVDWGLEKDLFIPFREQRQKTIPGKSYLVYIYLDEESGRIAGSTKYYKFLEKDSSQFQEGQEVNVLLHEETPIGFLALIEGKMNGLIYKNEVYNAKIRPGSHTKAFIHRVRDDGKIDLVLQKQGIESVTDFALVLLNELKKSNGFIALTDKSDPQLIYERFGVSKKVFKKGVGALYKKRFISLDEHGIKLT